MRRSDLVQYKEKESGKITRTSQIIFGERQHLLRVLDTLEGTSLPIARMQSERRMLEELIHARTRELNHINSSWDDKIELHTIQGQTSLPVEVFINAIGQVRLREQDIVISLPDVTETPGVKRMTKMVERTQKWLKALINSNVTPLLLGYGE